MIIFGGGGMPKPSTKPTKTPLNTDLLHFYDNFVELHDHCAFLCDAVACLAADGASLDDSTARGVSRYCHWMKSRMDALKDDLKHIREKARDENKAATSR